jgi:16S rRNA (cytidine1402-2'-O)-methyltransferase
MKNRPSHPLLPEQPPAGHRTIAPEERQNQSLRPGLYVTATPIGNARDITLRALDILQGCDLIAAEDTRVTAKLLAIYGISKPLIAYNDHNAPRQRPMLLRRLREGGRIAIVSDAGTPLISDPGWRLVREAVEEGLNIVAVPGASALLAALATAGLPTNRFCFVGFLPPKDGERRRVLQELSAVPATLVFFESAQRVAKCLRDMDEIMGSRPAAVARELTKLHEEVRRGETAALAAEYEKEQPKGELTIVVAPPGPKPLAFEKADLMLSKILAHMPLSTAVELVSDAFELPRNEIYKRALHLKSNECD